MRSCVMWPDGSFNMQDEGRSTGTRAEIDRNAIRGNVASIREMLPRGVRLMAVVKADGYGHGAVEAARMAVEGGAEQLAVAHLEEALQLRAAGLSQPMLVLLPIPPEQAELAIRHELMLTVASAEWFARLWACGWPQGRLRVHVKADTGLGRLGFRDKEEWLALAPWLRRDDVEVEGVYTHFATAGSADTSFLRLQYARFREMLGWCRASGVRPRLRHCAGSAAALRFPDLAMDMVRIGAAMYGFRPGKPANEELQTARSAQADPWISAGSMAPADGAKRAVDPAQTLEPKLKPAMRLCSRLIAVRRVRQGESLGYDRAYVAAADEWIGTVPIGYADGWSQSLRQGEVLVGGRRAPVVGKICMDQLMVKLPGPCEIGAEVVLIGEQGEARITAAELAAHLGGAPQEVTSALSPRVERVYV